MKVMNPIKNPVSGQLCWIDLVHERTKTVVQVVGQVGDVKKDKGLVEVILLSDRTCVWEDMSKVFTISCE